MAGNTQNISKGCFAFVPDIDLSKAPTDEMLYDHFELDADAIQEIETKIKPMPQAGDTDDK